MKDPAQQKKFDDAHSCERPLLSKPQSENLKNCIDRNNPSLTKEEREATQAPITDKDLDPYPRYIGDGPITIKETQMSVETETIGLHCPDCKVRFTVLQKNPLVHHEDVEKVIEACDQEFGRGNYRIDSPEQNSFKEFRGRENGKFIGYRDGTLMFPETRPQIVIKCCPFCGKHLYEEVDLDEFDNETRERRATGKVGE